MRVWKTLAKYPKTSRSSFSEDLLGGHQVQSSELVAVAGDSKQRRMGSAVKELMDLVRIG